MSVEHDPGLPLTDAEIDDLFHSLSVAIETAHEAEVGVHAALAEVIGG